MSEPGGQASGVKALIGFLVVLGLVTMCYPPALGITIGIGVMILGAWFFGTLLFGDDSPPFG